MTDNQARGTREALMAVLSTAASIGIDIDLLCHLSVEELMNGDANAGEKDYVGGAIYEIAVCMDCVIGLD
jgi:hypothetical protein